MPMFTIDENEPILVELTPGPGYRGGETTRGLEKVASLPDEVVERSEKALASAMNAIHNMARRVKTTIDAISDRPDTVEVTFGLKLTAGAGALIASAETEASINVKLGWKKS